MIWLCEDLTAIWCCCKESKSFDRIRSNETWNPCPRSNWKLCKLQTPIISLSQCNVKKYPVCFKIVPPKPAGRLWDDWEEYFREKNYNSWPDDVLVVTDTGPPLGPPDLDKKECDSSWHSYCRSWRSKLMSFSKNPQGFNFNTLQCHKSCSKVGVRVPVDEDISFKSIWFIFIV